MSFDKHSPYLSVGQHFKSIEEAITYAGKFACKYDQEEIVYKAVRKITPNNEKPRYDIEAYS